MSFQVHHLPVDNGLSWNLHAWQLAWDGNSKWEPAGTANGRLVDFPFPNVPDPRTVSFKFRWSSAPNEPVWESDDFVRQLAQIPNGDIWTFEQSRRVLYQDPSPIGAQFRAGDVLTFKAITKSRFRGGRLYAWNPYDPAKPTADFAESARDDDDGISTFTVPLAGWMTAGFHLKLVGRNPDGSELWEPDASNRVWRPADGATLWLKSGQCDVRSAPLTLTATTLEVLVPATLQPLPTINLRDVVEDLTVSVAAAQLDDFAGNPLFKVATYHPSIYPQATYTVSAQSGENPPIVRPFPADSGKPTDPSLFALGAGSWLPNFPAFSAVTLAIQPQAPSSFGAGLTVQVAVGNAPPYQSVSAMAGAGGSWTAALTVGADTTTCVRLSPVGGSEPTPYAWIDTGRYFTPTAATTKLFTAEGLFGITSRGPTTFGDPPSRAALMEAAFGAAIVGSGVFGANEMPQGTTLVGDTVYFVVHAPHAAWAGLVYVAPDAAGQPARQQVSMTLTVDRRYWWCTLPAVSAGPGTQYHFILNDDLEVMDPAAREVLDRGSFDVELGAVPTDPTTAWSVVADIDAVRTAAHQQAWQTMGWQNLLIYELHAARFTGLSPGSLQPLDLLADELNATSRLGQPGYLRALPVTAFELLPIQEFNEALSWGYDPSFYFAVDGHYGGGGALARFANTAHANGRSLLLDVVYNHSLGSPLMKIAPDVYRNGDYDGDRMNCGHPMVLEHFRQATVHLWRTFGVDGFRFDDTNTIVTKCEGGWEFLQAIRAAVRAAATAEGRAWPYCVAENSATNPWDISNPVSGVMDGQWGIDESYAIRDATYDSWNAGSDHAGPLAQKMNDPAYGGRPFSQAVRFGESHDMVSAQDAGNQRIAARPPFGQGLQMAKALGALTLLSNGIPMLFMGQEYGETVPFWFDSTKPPLDPQSYASPTGPIDNGRVLAWFRQLMGLRNDPAQGLQGDANYQVVRTGSRTVAFACGAGQCLFAVVTFGTANQQQDSSWLGLPAGSLYKEIFNSSWPVFAVEFEPEQTNGGYDARLASGQILNLPYIGAVVLQRA
jgi:1,4-alpha-glucan branching enzyme